MSDEARLARKMFEAYNAQGPNPNKTWDGKDVPAWEDLGEQVRGKWMAAARAAMIDLGVPEKPARCGAEHPEIHVHCQRDLNHEPPHHFRGHGGETSWVDQPNPNERRG
jgi:hypothetical protein